MFSFLHLHLHLSLFAIFLQSSLATHLNNSHGINRNLLFSIFFGLKPEFFFLPSDVLFRRCSSFFSGSETMELKMRKKIYNLEVKKIFGVEKDESGKKTTRCVCSFMFLGKNVFPRNWNVLHGIVYKWHHKTNIFWIILNSQ